jgi:hypothetical protein
LYAELHKGQDVKHIENEIPSENLDKIFCKSMDISGSFSKTNWALRKRIDPHSLLI